MNTKRDKLEGVVQEAKLQQTTESKRQIFELQRVYIKNIELQLTDQTEAFLLKWEPKISFEIKTVNSALKAPDSYEVVLEGTIKLDIVDRDIGTLKVGQAGIFKIEGFDDDQKKMILNGHCQDLLYPYFCSQVSKITADAGFPALLLRPMSFTFLYQQNVQKQEQKS